MKKYHVFVLFLLLICSLYSGCIGNSSQETNSLVNADYDSSKDYFPDKINIEYAQGFSVEYNNNYKLVTVKEPDTDDEYTYILVQKGTPVPEHDSDSVVIEIPVDSVAALSTTHLPALEVIGETDKLKAVSSFIYINSAPVRHMIEEGTIEEVGTGSYMNTESIIRINPDVIFTLTTGVPYDDKHIDNLIDLGLKPVVVDEYKETSALGEAEWIKFISLFFNAENEASEYFDQVASDYNELAEKAKSVEDKPVVMSGMAWQGTWYVPGGNSLITQYIKDAGATYFWNENNNTATVTLDFEAVLDMGKDADYWVSSGIWDSTEELEAEDPLYLEFKSVNNGNVYTSYYKVNENGGNDYYESGVVRPDLVLADFVKMFHPELVPDHEMVYHKRIE
ncbi:ABC transporter substrate-binding protein [Methanolobus psychrotolerans]|uniref:ABC transporter substrate-binding protein n=1 Tax=Methanolobus psychrotolerans TaxID=1874706 RepID=UPI000B915DD5|nr:ABC transporter substrate-binding protein [Methanolobus psychrotolerans]